MISPSRILAKRLPAGVLFFTVSIAGCLSEQFALPVLAADDPAAKADDSNSVEVPGAFKDPSSARGNRASKIGAGSASGKSKSDDQIEVDTEKGFTARGATPASSKARTVSIPLSLVGGNEQLHDFNATAYCLKGRTASGHEVRPGIIAADPRLLPIGTVVHVQAGKYTGVYTVLDTGGRIKGRIIDVYVPTRREAREFGRRPVKLKVIGRANLKSAAAMPRGTENGQF